MAQNLVVLVVQELVCPLAARFQLLDNQLLCLFHRSEIAYVGAKVIIFSLKPTLFDKNIVFIKKIGANNIVTKRNSGLIV